MVPIKNYEPEKICTVFEKGRNTTRASSDLNINHSIIFSIPENHTVMKVSSSYAQNVEFCIFAKRMIRDACLFIFFCRGDHIEPVIVENRERAHLIEN